MRYIFLILILLASACVSAPAQTSSFTFKGVTVKWLGHAGFEIIGSKKIYLDPFMASGEKADFILLTHDHFDHCDKESISRLQQKYTKIIGTLGCIKNLSGMTNLLRPGEEIRYSRDGINISAVEAYNIDKSYHPKGAGIGFLIVLDNVTIYDAGDTDFIPEMKNIRADIALLPIGGKYTMGVDEAADAARAINPKILVPMHYNSEKFGINDIGADPTQLDTLKDTGIEVKILSASAASTERTPQAQAN